MITEPLFYLNLKIYLNSSSYSYIVTSIEDISLTEYLIMSFILYLALFITSLSISIYSFN